MKIGGVEVSGVCEEVLVLPRLSGNIVIKARACTNLEVFDALCPPPTAPALYKPGGKVEPDLEDAGYSKQLADHNQRRFDFICITSLEPSDIEWGRVDLDKPNTWNEWQKELHEAGLSSVELQKVVECILTANSLNERKLKEARDAFLRGQGRVKGKSSGRQDEQPST